MVGLCDRIYRCRGARLAGQVSGDRKRPGAGGEGRKILAQLGLGNVTFRAAAAADGDPANAPYDVIVLNGATEVTPDRLYGQLKDGGRLVGVFAMTQPPRATIVTRSHGDFGHRALFDASVPVLPGLGTAPRVRFLVAAQRQILFGFPHKSRSESEVWPGCPT